MRIVIMNKNNFNQIDVSNVTSISYADGIYTVTVGGASTTYSKDDYIIMIIN